MATVRHRRLAAGATLVALGGAILALQRPAPLFLNFGTGDAVFARGFRGGWERDGLGAAGETTFRWAVDGSRIVIPDTLRADRATLRMRVARFVDVPATVTVRAGGRLIGEWLQHPRGWSERSLSVGALRGPLELQIRSDSSDPEGLAIAIDWIEIDGVERVWPAPERALRLFAWLVGIPALIGLALRRADAALVAFGFASALAGAALSLDRFGGMLALTQSALPALCGTAALAVARRLLRPHFELPDSSLIVPVTVLWVTIAALSHPSFYYPDVDVHAGFLREIRADPSLAWDPSSFQERVGAWTRRIGDARVAFPYSAAFHLAAWPAALAFGESAAVKLLGTLAVSLTILLTYGVAAALALEPRPRCWAQAAVALLPVTSSRLVFALYPALLGQALELALALVLIHRLPAVRGRFDLRLAVMLFVALAAYTGSLFNVTALVTFTAVLAWAARDRRAVTALATAWALGATATVLLLYARFVPVFVERIVPALGAPPPDGGTQRQLLRGAFARLWLFYGPLLLPAAIGWWKLRRAPQPSRRVVDATLLAGLLWLAARYAAPALFRDVKEIELLAAPFALTAVAGLAWIQERGAAGRIVALAGGAGAAYWGVTRAIAAYADRFVAIGR